jgi:hypothetical protein
MEVDLTLTLQQEGSLYSEDTLTTDLAILIAKRFIQRRDVKAVQIERASPTLKVGDWMPDRSFRNKDTHGLGFKMHHLEEHLQGLHTYGHYLIDSDNRCRVFCLDIDLEKSGSYVQTPPRAKYSTEEEYEAAWKVFTVTEELDPETKAVVTPGPRQLWLDRSQSVARDWWKWQMKLLAHKLCVVIHREMDIPCAAAYSGSKGVHVYGFIGESTAQEAHDAALLAVNLLDEFEPGRGKVFFHHRNKDPLSGFPSFSVEAFPKQASLEGKDLGNLVRLPLGRNLKSTDPTFFLDMTAPLAVFAPHPNPARLLETGEPFV